MLKDLFPRVGREDGDLLIRDESQPAPRLQAILEETGPVGGLVQPDATHTDPGADQPPEGDPMVNNEQLGDEQRRAMKLQIAEEVMTEAWEIASQVEFQEEVVEEEAPSPEEIRGELSEWALNLARKVALPASRANDRLSDLAPSDRSNLLRVGRRLQQSYG